ncbi:MAG: hypothetical protein PHT69_07845 [Bacteroidales bacterium]|nr:hypothetical protein [Bacteroidales bacterium]
MQKLNLSLLFSFLMSISCFLVSAQEENTSGFNIGVDLYSRYVWRGQDFGSAPSIQPSFEFAHKSGFKLGYWGAFSTNGTYNEIDFKIAYDVAGFSVELTDYFLPVSGVPILKPEKYFNFDNATTGHLLEGSIIWNGTEKIPVSFLAGAYVYGCDKNATGAQNYSAYAEVTYTFSTKAGEIQTFLGFTPKDGLYGNTAGVVNAGVTAGKTIQITDSFSLPVTASVITNPQANNIYFVLGISF